MVRKIALFLLIALLCLAFTGCSSNKYNWQDVVVRDRLPTPASSKGEIHLNSATELLLTVEGITSTDYADYVALCKQNGYVNEAKETSYSYSAFHTDGYNVMLTHNSSSNHLSITLKAPMELSPIVWPNSEMAQLLPTPVSSLGKILWENDDGFVIYIGETSLIDFNEYVDTCIEMGFVCDQSRGDEYYYADSADGYELYLNYQGNSIVCIHIECPDVPASTVAPEVVTEVVESDAEPLYGQALVESIVTAYNQSTSTPITDLHTVDVTDRNSEHYRTEFRLGAFEGAYAQTGRIGDINIDIVTYGYGKNDDVRIYADGITLEQAIEIITYASPILDSDLGASELTEILDYVNENKEANGKYYGDLGLVLLGKYSSSYELMIKYE